MRRGFSPTSAFGALLIAAGAVLLCTRLAQAQSPNLPISPWLALALEMGIYAALLALFDVPKSILAYPVGAAVLALVRWGIVSASASIVVSGSGDVWQQAASMDRSLILRIASMVFAVMVLFPLRDILQARTAVSEPAGARGLNTASESDTTLLFGAGNSGKGAGGSADDEDAGTDAATALPSDEAAQIEGSIIMPAQTALKNLSPDRVNGRLDPALEIEIPLNIIVPQLKEAQVMVGLEALAALLPAGAMDVQGPPVEIPLDEVVTRLPAEVLERPKAAPPAWAQVEAQMEELLFTAV